MSLLNGYKTINNRSNSNRIEFRKLLLSTNEKVGDNENFTENSKYKTRNLFHLDKHLVYGRLKHVDRSNRQRRLLQKFDLRKYQTKLLKYSIIAGKQTEFQLSGEEGEWNVFLDRAKASFYSRMKTKQDYDINLKHFTLLNKLGHGSYGDVMLAMKNDTEDFFAIKVINKYKMVKKGQIPHAKQEKNISASLRFPFTVYMHYFFQSEANLFYVLQLVLGKTLYDVANRNKMTEDVTRFFGAQILLGLEYLHFIDVIFRDLKLENVVMDQTGYIKITDFGFAKVLKGRTYTICGTPEYMAPELFEHKGYGMSVDWWAFGILVYELCAGFTPFNADNITVICAKIQKGHYKCPNHFSANLKDLVQNILVSDVTRRYGCITLGVDRIKFHKWFSKIDWIDLFNKKLKGPVTCGIGHLTNMKEIEFSEKNASKLDEKEKLLFKDF